MSSGSYLEDLLGGNQENETPKGPSVNDILNSLSLGELVEKEPEEIEIEEKVEKEEPAPKKDPAHPIPPAKSNFSSEQKKKIVLAFS